MVAVGVLEEAEQSPVDSAPAAVRGAAPGVLVDKASEMGR
jgi:hypothetical protein